MGILISRFRKKKSTIEVLEGLEKEIDQLEGSRKKHQERQRRLIATLILYSIVIYIGGAVVFYFYFFPDKWKERLLYSLPLLVFPLVIWVVKRTLHWYFVKRIAGNDMALQDLRDKKQKILEDVMEKETYKKAKEILEKYDPARFKEIETPKPKSPTKSHPGTELRQRTVQQRSPPGSQIRPGMTPRLPTQPVQSGSVRPGMTPYGPRAGVQGMQPRNLMVTPQVNGYGTPQGPPLPRPILPRDRGLMDRMLEYLVGDGPQNRYALICRNCSSHNGMALKEEFEYIDFRCCYCYAVNPAKKKRPFAPRIEQHRPLNLPQPTGESQDESDDDDEESADGDDENSNNSAEDDVGLENPTSKNRLEAKNKMDAKDRLEESMETIDTEDGGHDIQADNQDRDVPFKEQNRELPNES